jgi:hypothetical protein
MNITFDDISPQNPTDVSGSAESGSASVITACRCFLRVHQRAYDYNIWHLTRAGDTLPL